MSFWLRNTSFSPENEKTYHLFLVIFSLHLKVPPYSVIVPGSLPGKALPDGSVGPSLYCTVIVKRVDEKTRSKTSINDLLRD